MTEEKKKLKRSVNLQDYILTESIRKMSKIELSSPNNYKAKNEKKRNSKILISGTIKNCLNFPRKM